MQKKITDDLDALLGVLPASIRAALEAADRGDELLEVVMDLGRLPEARFLDHELVLSQQEVTAEQIDEVVSRVSEFDEDNRAGADPLWLRGGYQGWLHRERGPLGEAKFIPDPEADLLGVEMHPGRLFPQGDRQLAVAGTLGVGFV